MSEASEEQPTLLSQTSEEQQKRLSQTSEAHVQDLRRRLLDLRTGNRLIHFPHAARGRNYVRAVDELPEVLHKKLVDGRALRILALPEVPTEPPAQGDPSGSSPAQTTVEDAARLCGVDPSYELPLQKEHSARRHTDDAVQTLLFPELHQKTLARIADNTRLAQEEQGIHTLFAAFGFLEWYEQSDAEQPRFAPLVLYPLKLQRERKLAVYTYAVSAHDEEAEVNLALSERLRRDYGLSLPTWEEEDELADYFARVSTFIAVQPRWKLHRWVTISNFSFARISMYHDLDAEGWPAEQTPHAHPTFRALTTDRTSERPTNGAGNAIARWHDESADLPALADALPSLVLDADSSQVAAVLEALEQRNLVIKGPPGTGKSQTIANLIASSLARGQRVLFVAEKLAALEVVKARLDRAGLGEFCLELHSHRGTRKAVMETLATRLALRPSMPRKLETQRARAAALRSQLNDYADALNTPHGALGSTVHGLIWRREQQRAALEAFAPALGQLRVAGVAALTPAELDAVRHLLRGFQQAAVERARAFQEQESSLWYGLTDTGGDEETLLALLETCRATLLPIRAILDTHLGTTLGGAVRLQQVAPLCALARELPETAQLKAGLIDQLGTRDAQESLREVLLILQRRESLLSELRASCRDLPAAQTALDDLRRAAQRLAEDGLADTLAAARTAMTNLTLSCEELTRGTGRLAQLVQFAGLSDPEDADTVLALQDALSALSAASPDVWRLLRSAPALTQDHARAELKKLAAEASLLGAQRSALDQRVVRGKNDRELCERGAEYAIALRRPWWFAWLFRMYWSARSLHARIAREPNRPARTMADDLIEAQRTLDALTEFAARGPAQALCGPTFQGVDSDFALLGDAADWADGVRKQFARMHPAAAVLRTLLLSGELTQVETLLEESRRQPLDPFWQLARRAEQRGQPLSKALAQDREQARTSLLALDQLAAVGLSDQLSVAALGGALDGIAELSHIDGQLLALQRTLTRLGVTDDPRTLDLTELSVTLGAAEAGTERGLAIAWVAALRAPDTRQNLARALVEPLDRLERDQAALPAHGLEQAAARLREATLPDALELLTRALAARPLLRAQLRYLRELRRARETFAKPVVEAALRSELPLDMLVEAAEYLLYGELLTQATGEHPVLSKLNGSELASMRAQFRELDREILTLQAGAIATELSRVPIREGVASGKKSDWSELALIKHELSKKMRHVPLRQLMRRAGEALGALKPCFMMSPLTVAQFLPQLADRFDLVVIDEASQMRPEDALGAIVRGKRSVVVGDPKQLPPTSFFHRLESTEDDEPELLDKDEPIDQESILDLGVASFGDTRDLRWHYRSRHPSLIAFSNQHFYDGRLKVFPSPVDQRSTRGVQLVQTNGAYEGSLNPIEAERIALGVQRHVRSNPKLTLGVVAMNQRQKELIRQKIDELKDESVRAFVDASNLEQPFFVKSLENVQGDERDVIFVSLTYGPDPVSKKVRQNFGPINSQYGARRLNVLFTRARERLVVFSSLRPEDVRAEDGASHGLLTLRKYLSYAEHGVLPNTALAETASEGTFADVVRATLEQAGYGVVPRVGVQGFFLELGVRTPGGSGFACGIECDGADYHAQRSVRDRDRLRHEVLEAQGWQIVRVWSIDWFRAPLAARERLLREVAAHVAAQQ